MAPKKILIMRFQALGDTVITLPYLQSLKHLYPKTELHFLTRKEVSAIPEAVDIFKRVIAIGGGRSAKAQFALLLLKMPWLWRQRYDAVIDLQNHKISKIVRRLVAAKAWTEFDRTSSLSAGERTKNTIEAIGFGKIKLDSNFKFKTTPDVFELNRQWKPGHRLVALNLAGFSPSRNWRLENYIAFAKLWLEQVDDCTQFVLLLLPSLQEKATLIEEALGDHCIDLTGKADQVQAFYIVSKCSLMLSEDSGLMHMAWIQRVPTLALFSSSRKDWSAPQGEWSYCFDSADLPCGPCMLEVCRFNDNRCLTRYTPAIVLQKARELCGK